MSKIELSRNNSVFELEPRERIILPPSNKSIYLPETMSDKTRKIYFDDNTGQYIKVEVVSKSDIYKPTLTPPPFDESKRSVIIIEGAQGVGKTGMQRHIHQSLSYREALLLSGSADMSITGLQKAIKKYMLYLALLDELSTVSMDYNFDRIYFTEEVYDRFGAKDYCFSDAYLRFNDWLNEMHFNIYTIFLYVNNPELFRERLARGGKGSVEYMDFNTENSVKQQDLYLAMSKEFEQWENIHPINIATDDFEEAYKTLHYVLPPLTSKRK